MNKPGSIIILLYFMPLYNQLSHAKQDQVYMYIK